MYLNKLKKPNGDIYLSIREKYHVPKKGSRECVIESIGYVNALKDKYDDPIAFFTKRAKELTTQKKIRESQTITINTLDKMNTDTNDIRNIGYCISKPASKKGTYDHRDLSVYYFDCTNYYFDIGRSWTQYIGQYLLSKW